MTCYDDDGLNYPLEIALIRDVLCEGVILTSSFSTSYSLEASHSVLPHIGGTKMAPSLQ